MDAIRFQAAYRGMTLIEVMIAISIVMMLVLVIGQVMATSQAALAIGVNETDLQTKALTVVDEIANDVKDASAPDGVLSGTSDGIFWFRRCLGNYKKDQFPDPSEPAATSDGLYWSTKKTEYRKEETVNGVYQVSKYENGVRVKVLAMNVSDFLFSTEEVEGRMRIRLRLEREYYDPLSGAVKRVEAFAGTDVMLQN